MFLEPFGAKIEKRLGHFCLWVYNFEFFFGGSPHLLAPLVKRNKLDLKKSFFRDTLIYTISSHHQVPNSSPPSTCILYKVYCAVYSIFWAFNKQHMIYTTPSHHQVLNPSPPSTCRVFIKYSIFYTTQVTENIPQYEPTHPHLQTVSRMCTIQKMLCTKQCIVDM